MNQTNLLSPATFRYFALASSSRYGNSYLIESPGGTRILLDLGVPLRRSERALLQHGVDPGSIHAICLSHAHRDHTAGLSIKYPLPVRHRIARLCASEETLQTLHRRGQLPGEIEVFKATAGRSFQIADVTVTAAPTSHDSEGSVAFLLETEQASLGFVTDLGRISPNIINLCRGVQHLIIESNHDAKMEQNSGRPPRLIRRVLSDTGHLSNQQAAVALSQMVTRHTLTVLLAHLSLECNRPGLAHQSAARGLESSRFRGTLQVAPADRSTPWIGASL